MFEWLKNNKIVLTIDRLPLHPKWDRSILVEYCSHLLIYINIKINCMC